MMGFAKHVYLRIKRTEKNVDVDEDETKTLHHNSRGYCTGVPVGTAYHSEPGGRVLASYEVRNERYTQNRWVLEVWLN